MSVPRRRLWRTVAVCNAGGLLFAVLLAEAAFGGWFSGENFAFLNVPRNVSLRYDTGSLFDRGVVRYSRDQYGLRGRRKPLGAIDILTLGGSTIDQVYIDDAGTWQELLEMQLNAVRGDLDVVNAGIDGQSTFGHLRNFDHWFARLPDLKARYVLA